MNIRNKTILICLSVFVAINGFGQTKQELNKNVEVVKKYSPKIGSATKYDIVPEPVTKLVFATPVFDYSIAFEPQRYGLKISQLESFDIIPTSADYSNGYAEAAFGYPLISNASLYYTTKPSSKLFLGAAITHKGFFGTLENDANNVVDAFDTQNSVTGLLNYKLTNFKLDAQMQYNYNSFDKYGVYYSASQPSDFEVETNSFNVVDYDISGGTLFSQNKKWDIRGYSYGTYIADNSHFSGGDINVGFDAAFGFKEGRHKIMLSSEYAFFSSDMDDIINNVSTSYLYSGALTVSPSYKREGKNSTFEGELGFVTSFFDKDFDEGGSDFHFLPSFRYELRMKRFNLELGVDSELTRNTYSETIRQNPYLLSGQTAPDTYSMKGYVGINGTISTWFNWGAEVGYRKLENAVVNVNINDGAEFILTTVGQSFFYVDATMSVQMMNKFIASVNYVYQDVSPIIMAQHELNLNLQYKFHPKWTAKLNGELLTSRDFYEIYGNRRTTIVDKDMEVNSVPTTIDLALGIEYKLSKTFSFTIDFGNILNQKLYKFNHYSGMGISAMGGVNISF